nr:MAG TPA: resistance to inhibitors of cholinesterase-like protein [Caudoviricetes sp.]
MPIYVFYHLFKYFVYIVYKLLKRQYLSTYIV